MTGIIPAYPGGFGRLRAVVRPGSSDNPCLHPVGEVADVASIAEIGVQDQVLSAADIDIDGLGIITAGLRRFRPELLLAIDQDAKHDAPERPGTLVNADQGLESTISRLDSIHQERATIGPDATVVHLAGQLERTSVNRPIGATMSRGPDIGDIDRLHEVAFLEVDHQRASGR